MRSITTEIYEELNKNRSPLGVNRTDILQNIIDYMFNIKINKDAYNSEFLNAENIFFEAEKKNILEKIKESYQNKDKQ